MDPSAPNSTSSQLLRAGAIVVSADRVHFDSQIRLSGGRVASIDPASYLEPWERERVIAPGLVDAHTHLDLGALARAVPSGDRFLEWVGRIVRQRAGLEPQAEAAGVRRSARALLETGTTAVIDIDGSGGVAEALGSLPLRAVLLREVIDGSPEGWSARSTAALAAAREALERRQTERRSFGVSPHGPHTLGDELMARVADLHPTTPVAIHWAETEEEGEWLVEGGGPFADWLGPSPGVTGTERLARAGLLDGALLVHGNRPRAMEVERAARAGATLVHCPGSHAFFGRPRFSIETYREAGVPVALGTDSWASNDALDMRREMQLARESLGLEPREAWRMATERGAAHLPWPEVTGRLEPGDAADLAVFRLEGVPAGARRDEDLLFDRLTSTRPEVVDVRVGGRPALE